VAKEIRKGWKEECEDGKPLKQFRLVHVEDRIPKSEEHPIQEVKKMIGAVFRRLDPEFEDLTPEAWAKAQRANSRQRAA